MIYCITDIGSNTVKCNIYEYDGNEPRLIDFLSKRLGLIAKIKNNRLPKENITELCNTVMQYKNEVSKYGEYKFYCFATQALRAVSNSDEIKAALFKIGVKLDLISGEEEAKLSFLGLREVHKVNSGLMIDMGGASTELLSFSDNKTNGVHSFAFGCLYLRKEYVKNTFPSKAEKDAIQNRVLSEIRNYEWIENNSLLCLVGGTANAIKKLLLYFGEKDSDTYSIQSLYNLTDKLTKDPEKYKEILAKTVPERTDTILPGAIAYRTIAEHSGAKEILISKGGIRDGHLLAKTGENI